MWSEVDSDYWNFAHQACRNRQIVDYFGFLKVPFTLLGTINPVYSFTHLRPLMTLFFQNSKKMFSFFCLDLTEEGIGDSV